MIAAIIVLAVILLFCLILSINLNYYIIYSDNGFITYARVLWFKFYLYGEPEEKLKLRDFKIKRFRKRRDKAVKTYNKSLAKKSDKTQKKKISSTENKSDTKKTGKKFSSFKPLLDKIKEVTDGIFDRFPRYMKLDIRKFRIVIGCDEAHETALVCAGAIQALQYLICGIKRFASVNKTKNADVGVYPEFQFSTFKCDIDIHAHIRLGKVITLGIIFLKNLIKSKLRKQASAPSKERMAK